MTTISKHSCKTKSQVARPARPAVPKLEASPLQQETGVFICCLITWAGASHLAIRGSTTWAELHTCVRSVCVWACMCTFEYVRAYECCVCMYVCVSLRMYMCVCVCACCMCIQYMSVCVCVCINTMCVCVYSMCVCVFMCVCVCVYIHYVCMYVCMYVCVCGRVCGCYFI